VVNITSRAYKWFCTTALVLGASVAALAGGTFTSSLDGSQAITPNTSISVGTGSVLLNAAEDQITVTLFFTPLASSQTTAAIQDSTGTVIFDLPVGNFTQPFDLTSQQATDLKAGLWYFEVRSAAFPSGEIRGQIKAVSGTQIPFPSSVGMLDATFGTNGILSTAVGSGNATAQAVAVQTDGKIVAAGYTFNGANNDFAVVRYNSDGTLDGTFDGNSGSGNGIVTTAVGTGNDEAFGMAIQSDGKIIVAGQSSNGVDTDIAFVRYNADGTLDNSFSSDGRAIFAAGVGNDMVRSVAVQTDGKIVAVGTASNGTNTDIVVVRLNAFGSLDRTFGGNGIVLTPVGTGNDVGYNAAIQPDGKIVASGYYRSAASTDTAVLRYNADGTLDSSFDGDGIAVFAFSPDTDEALALALQPDGKIVIAGCIRSGGTPNDFLHARLNQNGSLDTSFGTNGSITVPFSSLIDIALGVVIQPDGKIVAAGIGSNGSNNDFSVTRLNADGSTDSTFDGDGRLQTPIGASGDNANAIAVQADGKIVVVGRTVNGSISNFGVVRYGYGLNSQGNDGFIGLNATTAIRFDNAYQSGNSSVSILNSAALPPLPSGWSFIGSPRVINTSAQFLGNILVKLTLPANIDQANFEAVRVLQFENGAWNDKTAVAPPRDFATKSVYAIISSLSPIAAASPNGLVMGTSAISGRLQTRDGRGVSGALVTAMSATGELTYAYSNPFGYFRFQSVRNGENYVLSVSSKRHKFIPQILSSNGDLIDAMLISR